MTSKSTKEMLIKFLQETMKLSTTEFKKVNQEKRLTIKQGKNEEEFWLSYAKKNNISLPPNWIISFRASMKNAIGINQEMYALVDELKEKKLRVALLSNIDTYKSKLIRDFGLYIPFDPCLLSCEIGSSKPDQKAYQMLLDCLQLPAKDVVFIDDKPVNIQAAQKLDIDAILFESAKQIRNELSKRAVFNR
ncbi:MAG: HAD-IA family hydrolase [Chlamydiales bacterium]|nr:HAD-IA family hydrolase [Chlamydiales bacterium]